MVMNRELEHPEREYVWIYDPVPTSYAEHIIFGPYPTQFYQCRLDFGKSLRLAIVSLK